MLQLREINNLSTRITYVIIQIYSKYTLNIGTINYLCEYITVPIYYKRLRNSDVCNVILYNNIILKHYYLVFYAWSLKSKICNFHFRIRPKRVIAQIAQHLTSLHHKHTTARSHTVNEIIWFRLYALRHNNLISKMCIIIIIKIIYNH